MENSLNNEYLLALHKSEPYIRINVLFFERNSKQHLRTINPF